MMKKIVSPLLLMMFFLQGCLGDSDPIPEVINSYISYHNYLMEPYDIQWEIDDVLVGNGHSYGVPAQAHAILDHPEQEVLIKTQESDTDRLIDSLSYLLFENAYYMVAVMGSEEDPYLLCEPLDLRYPSTGKVKVRFMHAADSLGPVDIYIDGDLPENKVLSAIDYKTLTEYLEMTEEELWNAVIITPENTLPADSSILSYTANTIFRTGRIYLCCIAHSENYRESSYQIHVDEQSSY